MIQLEPRVRQMVEEILRQHLSGQNVLAFGSRVVGTPRTYSDLDLCIMGDAQLSHDKMIQLRQAFSESWLPMRVDVSEWVTLSPEFREVVQKDGEALSY